MANAGTNAPSEMIIERSSLDYSFGTILLIHGSAPFNVDGVIPGASRDLRYVSEPFFRDLSIRLRAKGWAVARYSKPGVSDTRINFNDYRRTSYRCLCQQLQQIWTNLPNGKRIVFAWSEGTLHVRALPLSQMSGVILLGGIATNIGDVIAAQGGPDSSQMKQMLMSRDPLDMLGMDRPVGRLLEELELEDNWKVFLPYPNLPLLILHGGKDEEVNVQQARTWREQLPNHKLTVRIGDTLDHRYMPTGQYKPDLPSDEIITWLNETLVPSR
jgi:hypothetical protein